MGSLSHAVTWDDSLLLCGPRGSHPYARKKRVLVSSQMTPKSRYASTKTKSSLSLALGQAIHVELPQQGAVETR